MTLLLAASWLTALSEQSKHPITNLAAHWQLPSSLNDHHTILKATNTDNLYMYRRKEIA